VADVTQGSSNSQLIWEISAVDRSSCRTGRSKFRMRGSFVEYQELVKIARSLYVHLQCFILGAVCNLEM
jgi:hypothetical protein